MSEEHDDALRLYDRLNQTRANNGGTLSKEEWLRIGAELFRAVRDEERRNAGRNAKRSRGVRDPLFDTLATACGMNLKEITKTMGQAVGRAIAAIRTVTPDVTPEEITLRVNAYKRKNPTWTVSADSIAKWWPTLGTGRATAKAAETDPKIKNGEPVGWQAFLQSQIDAYHRENPGYNCDIEMYLADAKKGGFRSLPDRWQARCWKELQK